MNTQPNQAHFEFCLICDSNTPGECSYCNMCYNHAKMCQLCHKAFCPCISSFKMLMHPYTDWTKERNSKGSMYNMYCGSCIDKIMEKSNLSHILSREMGIKKNRKINMKFYGNKLITEFKYT